MALAVIINVQIASMLDEVFSATTPRKGRHLVTHPTRNNVNECVAKQKQIRSLADAANAGNG